MNEWKVLITPEAKQDIRDIYLYIADMLSEPDIAKGQIQRILNVIYSLNNMPLRFSLYKKEPWRSRGLRSVPADNYVIFYLPNEKSHEVVIFRVLYVGRNADELLPKK